MQHVFAASDGLRPACVVFEIGSEEGQAIARLGSAFRQNGAHVAFALQIPHSGADVMACGQKLQDAMTADETRPAGH